MSWQLHLCGLKTLTYKTSTSVRLNRRLFATIKMSQCYAFNPVTWEGNEMLRHGVDAMRTPSVWLISEACIDVLTGYGSNTTSLTQSYFKRDPTVKCYQFLKLSEGRCTGMIEVGNKMQHLIPFPGNRVVCMCSLSRELCAVSCRWCYRNVNINYDMLNKCLLTSCKINCSP